MKRCGTCGIEKPLGDYCKDRGARDGLYFRCRQCHSIKQAAYNATPEAKAKKAAQRLRWRTENPEKFVASWKKCNALPHSAFCRKRARARWEKSEAGKAWREKWRQDNPEKVAVHTAFHDAMRRGLLVRPNHCSKCLKRCKPDGHHHRGYATEHLLDVVWLCRPCHRQANLEAQSLRFK